MKIIPLQACLDLLQQMKMIHIKVKDDSVCENVCEICHQAEGGKIVEGAQVAEEHERD